MATLLAPFLQCLFHKSICFNLGTALPYRRCFQPTLNFNQLCISMSMLEAATVIQIGIMFTRVCVCVCGGETVPAALKLDTSSKIHPAHVPLSFIHHHHDNLILNRHVFGRVFVFIHMVSTTINELNRMNCLKNSHKLIITQ